MDIGNVLDMWDNMANDTKDYIRQTETGFYNAVESLRPQPTEHGTCWACEGEDEPHTC